MFRKTDQHLPAYREGPSQFEKSARGVCPISVQVLRLVTRVALWLSINHLNNTNLVEVMIEPRFRVTLGYDLELVREE